ncbi:MAG: GNAT family N-acetyltransferase [Longimicrobiales bacterium]
MKSIDLRPTRLEDLDFVLGAERDPNNARFILPWPRARHAQAMADSDLAHRIIEQGSEHARVGFVLLAGLTNPDRSVEFRRIVVTAKGQGLGRAAVRAAKQFAFVEHNAHRLWLDVKQHNARARRLYESEGFIVEGVLRECLASESGFDSLVVMSMLASEYNAPVATGAEEDAAADPAGTRNRILIERFYHDLWNRFDKSLIPELLTEDFVFRGGQERRGQAEFAAYVDFIRDTFPDFHNEIEEIISEGDRSFAALAYSATHRGELFGIPGTGRRVRYAGTALFRFWRRQIREVWVLGDIYGLVQQLSNDTPGT